MTKKSCTKCGTVHPATSEYFVSNPRCAGGLTGQCKKCRNEYNRNWDKTHATERREARRRRRGTTRPRVPSGTHPKLLKYGLKRCPTCKTILPATVEYFHRSSPETDGLANECRRCSLERHRDYYARNREQFKRYHVEHPENPAIKKERDRRYYLEHREQYNANSQRRLANPRNRVSHCISTGMTKSLRRGKSGNHWEKLVGYTLDELMNHLESQFTKGMSWSNYGAWHIDHIIPVSFFGFESFSDNEFRQCWSLKNLQPLWAFDNISKGNRR